jgi:hypothetical protein
MIHETTIEGDKANENDKSENELKFNVDILKN